MFVTHDCSEDFLSFLPFLIFYSLLSRCCRSGLWLLENKSKSVSIEKISIEIKNREWLSMVTVEQWKRKGWRKLDPHVPEELNTNFICDRSLDLEKCCIKVDDIKNSSVQKEKCKSKRSDRWETKRIFSEEQLVRMYQSIIEYRRKRKQFQKLWSIFCNRNPYVIELKLIIIIDIRRFNLFANMYGSLVLLLLIIITTINADCFCLLDVL